MNNRNLFEQVNYIKNLTNDINTYNNNKFSAQENLNFEQKKKTLLNENKNKEKNIMRETRYVFNQFKKNFFEFINLVSSSEDTQKKGNDLLKLFINSSCAFMDNILSEMQEIFMGLEINDYTRKDKNISVESNYFNSYFNYFTELSLINLYYEQLITQLFMSSFYERQCSNYYESIINYILTSPFLILKENKNIKEFNNNLSLLIYSYKKTNEEYIEQISEQNVYYIDNYMKLFKSMIFNKIDRRNSYIKGNQSVYKLTEIIDNNKFKQNTSTIFNCKSAQDIYLKMINQTITIVNEDIKKKEKEINDSEKPLNNPKIKLRVKGKNKINLLKISGDNFDKISEHSNRSSRVIDNYSDKPSFYGLIGGDDCPSGMSFEED